MDKPDEQRSFFISYTSADIAWAEWIADTLETAGLTTVLQVWDFRPGENFIERMNDALTQAERVLAVLSPSYFQSDYARDEWTAALVRGRGQPDRLLPVRIAACRLPPLLANRVYIDLADLDEPAAAQQLLAGVQPGRAKPAGKLPFPGGKANQAAPRFPGQRPAIFAVPPRHPHFTGRGELLKAIRRQLRQDAMSAVVQASAIHGLGGVGKTQLAVEYAHRYAADYQLAWWVAAEEPVAIADQLVALARRLGIPEAAEQAEMLASLWDTLGQRDRWLLIYDNATNPSSLKRLRPPAGDGHVLITSRNPAWRAIATTVQIDVLTRVESAAFLHDRVEVDQPTASALAEALGDLPLALEQAAAYLEETGTTAGEYLALLRERSPELFALGRPANYEQTIATTWTVALDRIRADIPGAHDLLALCAHLAPGLMPRALLAGHPEVLPQPLAGIIRDPLAFQQAVGGLRRYSLVTASGDTLGVHQLVQAVTRHQLGPKQAQQWATAAAMLVLVAFPEHPGDPATWPQCARLLPHALAVCEHAAAHQAAAEPSAGLLTLAARYLLARANHQQAAALLQQALSIREGRLGADHPDTALSLNNLALVLRDQGDLGRARSLHERALAIYEARPGADHLETAISLSNLAGVIRAQGDLLGARSLLERALAIFEARLGADHAETATCVSNLATILSDQGDLDQARSLHERVLAISEARLGADHPETATALSKLAHVLYKQGDLDQARSLHERALTIREARLGAEHPRTADSVNDLALVLHAQGDLGRARSLHERALAIYEARLGASHPDSLMTLSNLARVLYDQGDLDRARGLYEQSLSLREERLGADNPATADSLSGLATVLHSQGDLVGARRLLERALAIFEARLGVDHPDTLMSRRNLVAVQTALKEGSA